MDMYDAKLKGLSLDPQKKHGRHLQADNQYEGELITVFLKFKNDLTSINDLGSETRTVRGEIATGQIQLSQLETIVDHPHVLKIQLSRRMTDGFSRSMPQMRANQVRGMLADRIDRTESSMIIGVIGQKKRKNRSVPFSCPLFWIQRAVDFRSGVITRR